MTTQSINQVEPHFALGLIGNHWRNPGGEGKQTTGQTLMPGERIFSAYRAIEAVRFRVVTEGGRPAIIILFSRRD